MSGLSFDGFKVMAKVNSWQIDGFAMRPDLDKPGFFDNAPNHSGRLLGNICDQAALQEESLSRRITWGWIASVQHFSGVPRRSCVIVSAQGCRGRSRLNNPVGTSTTRRSGNSEHSVAANIRAWTVASETGYRLPTVVLKPRFSAKADISSGDHPKSDPNTLGTFNPLFPKGNYFGVLATTGPGPINFIDFHPQG